MSLWSAPSGRAPGGLCGLVESARDTSAPQQRPRLVLPLWSAPSGRAHSCPNTLSDGTRGARSSQQRILARTVTRVAGGRSGLT
jgi:hypothetical protein